MSYEVLTKTVEIDGETYEIRLLDAIAGSRLWFKMLNTLGVALSNMSDVKAASHGELALKTIGTVMANLSPELSEELRSTFARSCCLVKDGKRPELKDLFLTHFRGRYGHMSKWLFECLKANFSDFLADGTGDASSALAQLMGMFQSKSPPTSTGSSPAS